MASMLCALHTITLPEHRLEVYKERVSGSYEILTAPNVKLLADVPVALGPRLLDICVIWVPATAVA